jgi:hypothetical protein
MRPILCVGGASLDAVQFAGIVIGHHFPLRG